MSIKIELDSSEFTTAIREYQKLRKLDDQEAVADRAGKLSFEFFKAFKNLTPSGGKLRGLPEKLAYHIRRKKGMTVASEIKRRIRARFAAASGWLPAVWRFSRGHPVLRKKSGGGGFEINLSEPSVTITNNMVQAEEAEKLHHVMQGAMDAQTSDMVKYIERKLEQRAHQFSAK